MVAGTDMMKVIEKLRDKRGHYIVEASIILPIFLVGIITLTGIISIYRAYENERHLYDKRRFTFTNQS